jgi:hypothetical protein
VITAKVVLMDDPLSAVDSHVGQSLMQDAIVEYQLRSICVKLKLKLEVVAGFCPGNLSSRGSQPFLRLSFELTLVAEVFIGLFTNLERIRVGTWG